MAKKYDLQGGYFTRRDKGKLSGTEVDQTIAVLDLLDGRSLAQATVFVPSKELDEYKIRFLSAVIDS